MKYPVNYPRYLTGVKKQINENKTKQTKQHTHTHTDTLTHTHCIRTHTTTTKKHHNSDNDNVYITEEGMGQSISTAGWGERHCSCGTQCRSTKILHVNCCQQICV